MHLSTIKQIENYRHAGEPKMVKVGHAKGLRLHCWDNGTKKFKYIRKRGGKAIKVNIGAFPKISLEYANQIGNILPSLVDKGYTGESLTKAVQNCDDPSQLLSHLDEEVHETATLTSDLTFGDLHAIWYDKHGQHKKNKAHRQQNLSIPRNHLQHIYDRKMSELRRKDFLDAFEVNKLWRDMKPTAEKAITITYAIMRQFSVLDENWVMPAVSTNQLTELIETHCGESNHKVSKQPHLEYDRIREWYAEWVEGREDTMGNLALQTAMFSIKREAEVAALRWNQLDFDKMIWSMSGSDGKNGEIYNINITPRLMDIFERARAIARALNVKSREEFVFATDKSASGHVTQNGLLVQCHKTSFGKEQSVHGFRHTFSSWCRFARYPEDLRQYCMNQKDGGVRGHYGDYPVHHYTKTVMMHWEEFLTGEADADERARQIVS